MITPIELHNRQHKTGRGYSRKEMDLFLEEVYSNYESLYKENAELKEKLTQLSDGIQYYKAMENTLQKALVLAEQTSKDTIEAATAKAQLIEKEAGLKADTIVNNALSEAEKIKKECISLLKQYNQFKAQYKQIAVKQIELLDGDFYEIYSKDLIDAINDAAGTSSEQTITEETEETILPVSNDAEAPADSEQVQAHNAADVMDISEEAESEENISDSDSMITEVKEQDNNSIKEGDTKEFTPISSVDLSNGDDTANENKASETKEGDDPLNQLFKELREDLAKDVNDSPFEFIDNE